MPTNRVVALLTPLAAALAGWFSHLGSDALSWRQHSRESARGRCSSQAPCLRSHPPRSGSTAGRSGRPSRPRPRRPCRSRRVGADGRAADHPGGRRTRTTALDEDEGFEARATTSSARRLRRLRRARRRPPRRRRARPGRGLTVMALQGLDRASRPRGRHGEADARPRSTAAGGTCTSAGRSRAPGWSPEIVREYVRHGIDRFMLTYVGRAEAAGRSPRLRARRTRSTRSRSPSSYGYTGNFPLCLDVEIGTFNSAPTKTVTYAKAWCVDGPRAPALARACTRTQHRSRRWPRGRCPPSSCGARAG